MLRPSRETPCHHCTEETGRHLYCHATCLRYQEFQDAINKENRKVNDQKNNDGDYIHYMVGKKAKRERRNKRGGN